MREGRTVTVSHHDEQVEKIAPVERQQKPTLDQRLRDLERQRVLVRSRARQVLRPVEQRYGALARFLAERHE